MTNTVPVFCDSFDDAMAQVRAEKENANTYQNTITNIQTQQLVSSTRINGFLNAIVGSLSYLQNLGNLNTILTGWGVDNDYFVSIKKAKEAQLVESTALQNDLNNTITLVDYHRQVLHNNAKTICQTITTPRFAFQTYQTKSLGSNLYSQQAFETMSYNILAEVGTRVNNPLPDSPVTLVRNYASGGEWHFLILLPNNKLYSTGISNEGNLGRASSASNMYLNQPVEGLDGLDILQFDSNYRTNVILTKQGVYTFGRNANYQLGNARSVNTYVLQKVNGFAGRRVDQVVLGRESVYAIDQTGTLWAWGDNYYGQLGDLTSEDKYRPFKVFSQTGPLKDQKVTKVCAGYNFALALTKNNTLVSWGTNEYYQLGIGSSTAYNYPVSVTQSGALLGQQIVDIQCGYAHVLVLSGSGNVYAWGYNGYGQLGDSTTSSRSVAQKITLPSGCVPNRIFTKHFNSFVICVDGRLVSFGRNDYGQTGAGSWGSSYIWAPTVVSLPTTTHKIIDVAMTEYSTMIYYQDGSILVSGGCYTSGQVWFRSFSCVGSSPASFNYASFTSVTMYTLVFPWHQRVFPYFELKDTAYLLYTEPNGPSRSGVEFNMYTKSISDLNSVWTSVPYNSNNNTGFGYAIYNTHFFKDNEFMYMFGGFVNNEVSNAIFRAPVYNFTQGWEKVKQVLPFPVASGMLSYDSTYVYIMGGLRQVYSGWDGQTGPKIVNTIMRAPILNLTSWENVYSSALPKPLHSAHVYNYNSMYYIMGGLSQMSIAYSDSIYSASVTDLTKWNKESSVLPRFIDTAQPLIYNTDEQFIYVIGASKKGGDYSRYIGDEIMMSSTASPTSSFTVFNSTRLTNTCKNKYVSICGLYSLPTQIIGTADNEIYVYVNGANVLYGNSWGTRYSTVQNLKSGDLIIAYGIDWGAPAGILVELIFNTYDHSTGAAQWKCIAGDYRSASVSTVNGWANAITASYNGNYGVYKRSTTNWIWCATTTLYCTCGIVINGSY